MLNFAPRNVSLQGEIMEKLCKIARFCSHLEYVETNIKRKENMNYLVLHRGFENTSTRGESLVGFAVSESVASRLIGKGGTK